MYIHTYTTTTNNNNKTHNNDNNDDDNHNNHHNINNNNNDNIHHHNTHTNNVNIQIIIREEPFGRLFQMQPVRPGFEGSVWKNGPSTCEI